MHGHGTLKTPYGVYEGSFEEGLKHGKGTFKNFNKCSYIG